MHPADVKTAADAKKIVEQRGLNHVTVGVFDMDGILRGKYMSRDKFLSSLDGGFGFCDVVLGWDSKDQLYDNVAITGWHTGYPDAPVRLLPDTCREIPWDPGALFFLGEFTGAAEEICPRGVLRRVIDRAAQAGFTCRAGFEYEFFVFDETPQTARDKNYRGLTPMAPGFFGYSVLRSGVQSDFYTALLESCRTAQMDIEGLHEETGPGVMEAALAVSEGVTVADKAALFKAFTKILAQKSNLMATFMARWSSDLPGQSGHIHLSLADGDGTPVFHDPAATDHMSETMRHFIGGQQQLMPELLAMMAPTVNAYRRLVPGFWAPTDASWGIDNRTCALRVVPGGAKSHRVEIRVTGSDANPYLALAAGLAAGIWGIENSIEPDQPVTGNAYEKTFPKRLALPATLWDAAQMFRKSKVARELFGDAFVDHFAATREWEERVFRKHVSDWEMDRYFEII